MKRDAPTRRRQPRGARQAVGPHQVEGQHVEGNGDSGRRSTAGAGRGRLPRSWSATRRSRKSCCAAAASPNSSVIFDRLRDDGYEGGLTTARDFVRRVQLIASRQLSISSCRLLNYCMQADPSRVRYSGSPFSWSSSRISFWERLNSSRDLTFGMVAHLRR